MANEATAAEVMQGTANREAELMFLRRRLANLRSVKSFWSGPPGVPMHPMRRVNLQEAEWEIEAIQARLSQIGACPITGHELNLLDLDRDGQ